MEFKDKKIVAVIAHPDDETIGCGGFLSKASRLGATCKVILPIKRTNSRSAITWEDEVNSFKKSCENLGAIPIVTDELINDNTASTSIQKIAHIIFPYIEWADTVLCHWNNDIHYAHKAISKAVEVSTRPFRNPKTVLSFEVATSTDQSYENTFSPNCYISLDKIDVLRKTKSMGIYEKEIVHGRSPEDLEIQMRWRGSQSSSEFAEAFRILRCFI